MLDSLLRIGKSIIMQSKICTSSTIRRICVPAEFVWFSNFTDNFKRVGLNRGRGGAEFGKWPPTISSFLILFFRIHVIINHFRKLFIIWKEEDEGLKWALIPFFRFPFIPSNWEWIIQKWSRGERRSFTFIPCRIWAGIAHFHVQNFTFTAAAARRLDCVCVSRAHHHFHQGFEFVLFN